VGAMMQPYRGRKVVTYIAPGEFLITLTNLGRRSEPRPGIPPTPSHTIGPSI
jgi:hypothetical protein